MEIERKFTIKELPADLDSHTCLLIEQAYLNTDPVIRIRRQDDDYYLTYKGKGLMAREEYNLPLTREAYEHLLPKADGNIITKKRYLFPISEPSFREGYHSESTPSLTIELDVFEAPLHHLLSQRWSFLMRKWQMLFCRRTGSLLMSPWISVTTTPIYRRCRICLLSFYRLHKQTLFSHRSDYFHHFRIGLIKHGT